VAIWPVVPVRFFMEAGLLEGGSEWTMPSLLSCHRHMRDVLIAKGYDVTYREYPGGHDFYVWRGLLPDGLKHLLATS
jgi:enterochelin esterase family protein